MWPDRVSNPGPLTYESGALPTALRGPAIARELCKLRCMSTPLGLVDVDIFLPFLQGGTTFVASCLLLWRMKLFEKGILLNKRICSNRSKFISLRVDLHLEGRKI